MRELGTSPETSILIFAEDADSSVQKEMEWIEDKFGRMLDNWTFVDQLLFDQGDRWFDKVTIRLSDQKTLDIFFDVSDVVHRNMEWFIYEAQSKVGLA